MNAQATDYIDINKLKPPYKRTLRNDIKVVIGRFGKQKFSSKHVFWFLVLDEHYKDKDPDSLYSSIRPEVIRLAKEGIIEIVSRGTRGTPNVYRNKKHEE